MKMGAPEVASCCGLSLKHGTIIIGVTQSIYSFICFILSLAYAEHPHELIEMNDPSVVPDVQTLKIILSISAAIFALQCIFSILLIFGAASNRPSLFFYWLVINPFCLILYGVGTFTAIINHAGSNNGRFIIGHLLALFIVTPIVSYCILIVYSYRNYLKRLNF